MRHGRLTYSQTECCQFPYEMFRDDVLSQVRW